MKKLFVHFKYSLACAIAYCIPVFFLFESDKYSNVWLLYLGNFCFAFLLLASNIYLNSKKAELQTLESILKAAVKTEAASILISCIIVLSLIFIFKENNILKYSPANVLGLYFILPLSAILINLAVGSFCIFLWALNAKKKEG